MSVIMITGGSGYIGSELTYLLARRGDLVVNYDIVPPPSSREIIFKDISDSIRFERGNILDLSRILRVAEKNKIEKLVHCQRYSTGWSSVDEPVPAITIDTVGTLNLYEAARIVGFKKVVFMSTMVVYGNKKYEPIDEDHPTNPRSPYAVYKLACEHLGFNYSDLYGLDFIALRLSIVYGAAWNLKSFPQMFVENAVKGMPIKIEVGGDFQTNYVYIKDVINAIILALDATKDTLIHRVFNIMSGEYVKLSEMANLIKSLSPEVEIEIGPGMNENQKAVGSGPWSIERAYKELGYEPKYDLKKGIKDLMNLYEKQ